MLYTRIKTDIPKIDGATIRRAVRLYGFGPEKYQMLQLGNIAVASMKARVMSGLGSNDAPMPALKGKYRSFQKGGVTRFGLSGWARVKQRHGLKTIRDLVGTGRDGGHMLDALRVTSAYLERVVIDITTKKGRDKARANEQRAPWWGFSPRDMAAIVTAADRIFKGNVLAFSAQMAGKQPSPIWLDPLSLGPLAGTNPTVAAGMPARVARAYARLGRAA